MEVSGPDSASNVGSRRFYDLVIGAFVFFDGWFPVGHDFIQCQARFFFGAQFGERRILEQGSELIECDRFFGRIDKGFDFGFNAHW